jgi:hypothetical protein
MAKAYLGKISALVTANTSDFNAKLNASAKEVRSFASSMQASLTRAEAAASTSLRGIYTESQKVSRALQAVSSQRLSFKGFDTRSFASLSQAVDQFKRMQLAAVNVNEPLSQAARTVERLSSSVQTEFDPAMKSAQKSAEYLNAALERGGIVGEKSFERIRRQAVAAAEAADRLGEASQAVGGLATGRELRFANPAFASQLQRSREIQGRALAIDLETAARSPNANIAFAVQRQAKAARDAEVANAALEREQLRSMRDTSPGQQRRESGDLGMAAGANESLKKANDYLLAQVETIESIATEEQRRAAEARATTAAVEAQARSYQTLQQAVASALTGLPQTGRQARQEFEGLLTTIARLSPEGRNAVSPLTNDLLSLFNAADGGDSSLTEIISKLQQIKALTDDIGSRSERLNKANSLLPPVLQKESQALSQSGDSSLTLGGLQSQQESAKLFVPLGNLEKSGKDLREIESQLLRIRAAANFGTPLADLFESAKVDSYRAKLGVLQQTLIASGVTSGEAAEAVNEYAAALERASQTKGGLAAAASEIAKAERAAVSAVSAASGLSTGKIGESLKRAGDIGRGAFGNIGLGVQQAIFAFDDFFSVTGDLSQRIRAAGNNISQLGFILGGTAGLIGGVAVSAVAQLVAAYIKWRSEGVETQDSLKQLNDSLSRQKSLVESLAQAFSSLADEVGQIGFSKQGADASKFAKSLEDIRKKQAEIRSEQSASVDPTVQRERGAVSAAERAIQKASDPGERVRLNFEIREARARERARIGELSREGAIDPLRAVEKVLQSGVEIARVERRTTGRTDTNRSEQDVIRRANEELQAQRLAFGGLTDREQRVRAAAFIDSQQQSLRKDIKSNTDIFGIEDSSNEVRRRQLAELEALKVSLESGASAAADALEIEIIKAAREAAKNIGEAQDKVAEAIEQQVPGAKALQDELDKLAEQLVKSQNDLAAARESGAGAEAVDAAKKDVDAANASFEAKKKEVAAVDAARASIEVFANALQRVSQQAENNVQAAMTSADEARLASLANPNGANRAEEDTTARAVRVAEGLRTEVEQRVAAAEERFRSGNSFAAEQVRRGEKRIAEIDDELKNNQNLKPKEREQLVRERADLAGSNRAAARKAVEDDAEVRTARDIADRTELERQSRLRGGALLETPARRAANELDQKLKDIARATPLPRAGQERVSAESLRQSAPAIAGLALQVQNAVLQGPSRAALQASDVTTTQGMSELNRLLRGDDSARNQDIVELEKQSRLLAELVQVMKANGVPPVIEF